MARKASPSDVSDEEWALVAPYLTLMTEDTPQREHSLREVFNGLRWIVRAGVAWRMMPHDLPPWHTVYQQSQRWLQAGVFDAIDQDLRAGLRVAQGGKPEPSAAICDSRTLQLTPESGTRAGYDGAKRRWGSKVHMAVDTLGYLLALHATAASEQNRSHVTALAAKVQEVTGDAVAVAFVDQGYTGKQRRFSRCDIGNAGLTVLCPRPKIRSFVRPICHHCNPRGESIMLARKIRAGLMSAVVALGVALSGQAMADITVQDATALDAEAKATLAKFKAETIGAEEVIANAKGVLVCPKITKGGFIIGVEGGDCVLYSGASLPLYYSTNAVKAGFLAGVQSYSMILVINSDTGLAKFASGDREWEVGADASVAIAKMGAGGSLDTTNLRQAIVAFIFGERGLMADVSLEGSRFKKQDLK
jgi:lipid-binding SYLF domain-containing protein/transposase